MNKTHTPSTLTYELHSRVYGECRVPQPLEAMVEPEQIARLLDALQRLQRNIRAFTASVQQMTRVLESSSIRHIFEFESARSPLQREELMVGRHLRQSLDVGVDAGSRDSHAGYCWRCNAVEVPLDPKHPGACDKCLADLRGEPTS